MAETSAQDITTYNLAHLPGLVQSEEYTRALYEARGVLPPDQIETAVRFRTERTTLMRRHDRPQCTFYIHENALRLAVGSAEVMQDQLMRLLFNTHCLRVIRAASGPAGVFMANYVLWNFEKRSTVAHSESEIAQVFVQDPAGVNGCKKIFERLDAVALGEAQSRAMVADLASRVREDHSRQLRLV